MQNLLTLGTEEGLLEVLSESNVLFLRFQYTVRDKFGEIRLSTRPFYLSEALTDALDSTIARVYRFKESEFEGGVGYVPAYLYIEMGLLVPAPNYYYCILRDKREKFAEFLQILKTLPLT